jgi:hypothetical protein
VALIAYQPLDCGAWHALSNPFIVGSKGRIPRRDPVGLFMAK